MMRFAMVLASGVPFFVGLGMMAFAPVVRLSSLRAARSIAAASGLLGAGLVCVSGTPVVSAIAIIVIIATIAVVVPSDRAAASSRFRWIIRIAMAIVLVGTASLGTIEARYSVNPRLPLSPHVRIAVVGDSLSAGIGGGVTTWPDRVARDIGAEVRNLAMPGASVSTARQQVEAMPPDTELAILLIGGNDVLSRRAIADFERDLEAIVARVKAVVPMTVMFELPTVIFSTEYLAVQRRIAAKHRVPLIPRRHLAWVLAERGSTVDGLHLSDSGHQRVADTIRAILVTNVK